MNIAVVGYGRMGHEIEQVLQSRGHACPARIDPVASGADAVSLDEAFAATPKPDAVIEFAAPAGVVDNARWYADHGVAAVVGTTGWEERREEVRRIVERADGAYLWGANFSVGANLFFALVEAAGTLIDHFDDYDPMLFEQHHRGKKDSPSGTALEAARRLIAVSSRKKEIVTEALQRPINPEELHVASLRGGSVPGTHQLSFDSPFDTITVSHSARTRAGFALGSVLAAEWLSGRSGFYSVDDFFADQLDQSIGSTLGG
ncbi:MAG: 4-hydroxy-tetrahydrodipicolinate reductase [Spirochaetales bacterium]